MTVSSRAPELRKLPDYLAENLSIMFVGINPGLRSAEVGHHFAGHTNRFWKLLYDGGLIPFPMTYHDDWRLPEFGYGLTNVISRPTAAAQELTQQDFQEGGRALIGKIQHYRPACVAFLGVGMARRLLRPAEGGEGMRKSRAVQPVGLQDRTLADVPVFVLPNPSGRNAYYSYQYMKELFMELKHVSDRDLRKGRQREERTTG